MTTAVAPRSPSPTRATSTSTSSPSKAPASSATRAQTAKQTPAKQAERTPASPESVQGARRGAKLAEQQAKGAVDAQKNAKMTTNDLSAWGLTGSTTKAAGTAPKKGVAEAQDQAQRKEALDGAVKNARQQADDFDKKRHELAGSPRPEGAPYDPSQPLPKGAAAGTCSDVAVSITHQLKAKGVDVKTHEFMQGTGHAFATSPNGKPGSTTYIDPTFQQFHDSRSRTGTGTVKAQFEKSAEGRQFIQDLQKNGYADMNQRVLDIYQDALGVRAPDGGRLSISDFDESTMHPGRIGMTPFQLGG